MSVVELRSKCSRNTVIFASNACIKQTGRLQKNAKLYFTLTCLSTYFLFRCVLRISCVLWPFWETWLLSGDCTKMCQACCGKIHSAQNLSGCGSAFCCFQKCEYPRHQSAYQQCKEKRNTAEGMLDRHFQVNSGHRTMWSHSLIQNQVWKLTLNWHKLLKYLLFPTFLCRNMKLHYKPRISLNSATTASSLSLFTSFHAAQSHYM